MYISLYFVFGLFSFSEFFPFIVITNYYKILPFYHVQSCDVESLNNERKKKSLLILREFFE